MHFFRGLHTLSGDNEACALTIGNFDGVHLGHQYLLQHLLTQAQQRQIRAGIIIFEPQPQEYFNPQQAPPRLMGLREKLLAFRHYAIDFTLCLRFNARLANLSAQQFIEEYLVQKLAVRYLVVGEDFRFGKQRLGDIALLKHYSSRFNFEVVTLPAFCVKGQRVSSTTIRQRLAQGELLMAQALLGRPFTLSGRVVYGDARGRLLGFPTANIRLRCEHSPLQGVYAVMVRGIGDNPLPGVANIGRRPTFAARGLWLEVHLFDFKQDIYGQRLEVEFIAKLREEQRFATLGHLQAQISADVQQARTLFKSLR